MTKEEVAAEIDTDDEPVTGDDERMTDGYDDYVDYSGNSMD